MTKERGNDKTEKIMLKKKVMMIFLMLQVIFVPTVFAVSKDDSGRACESANGRFVDKNRDGKVNCFDWRRMSLGEKDRQAIWNIETKRKKISPKKVKEMVNRLNAACTNIPGAKGME